MSGEDKLARIFKVLSVETRVRIVRLLRADCLCVNALACRLGVTPAAVSQHLRILRDAGLVIPEKRGYFVHYRLNRDTLRNWRELAAEFLGKPDGNSDQGGKVCAKKRIADATIRRD